jgi:polar amino acid transport system substrate-binding protein
MTRDLFTMRTPGARSLALLVALALLLAACGGDDGTTEPEEGDGGDAAGTVEETAGCEPDQLPVHQAGTLTVATGEPVFEPWMVDDDPTNQEGFESALVYDLAAELGFGADEVDWVRTGFDEAIAPGDKPYDFNIQQYSITEEREEVVDFSDGYYQVEQALVAAADSPVAEAESLEDLRDARLGAAIGTTSLDYVEDVIAPETQAAVYNDNAAAKAAFDAGQVDGLVFDLPTAYYITAVEIPDAEIVGVLPRVGDSPEELGLLFEDGSELVDCVNVALDALRERGRIEELEDQWLADGGNIPTLRE